MMVMMMLMMVMTPLVLNYVGAAPVVTELGMSVSEFERLSAAEPECEWF